MQPSRQARLVCYAEAPFWMVQVNQAWTALMGYSAEQVKLLPLSLLNVSTSQPFTATRRVEHRGYAVKAITREFESVVSRIHDCVAMLLPRWSICLECASTWSFRVPLR